MKMIEDWSLICTEEPERISGWATRMFYEELWFCRVWKNEGEVFLLSRETHEQKKNKRNKVEIEEQRICKIPVIEVKLKEDFKLYAQIPGTKEPRLLGRMNWMEKIRKKQINQEMYEEFLDVLKGDPIKMTTEEAAVADEILERIGVISIHLGDGLVMFGDLESLADYMNREYEEMEEGSEEERLEWMKTMGMIVDLLWHYRGRI